MQMDSSVFNPHIPYEGPLPFTLKPSYLIKIEGIVPPSAVCFSINLQNGINGDKRCDIALHLSPVFSSPSRLVRNSLQNQVWGPEESHGAYFPLSQGQQFEILILAEIDHFKIAINGAHFAEFSYRLPLQCISHISIDGDVKITQIDFRGETRSHEQFQSGEPIVKSIGFIQPNTEENKPSAPMNRSPSPYSYPEGLPYPSNPSYGLPNVAPSFPPSTLEYRPSGPTNLSYPPSSNNYPSSPGNPYPTSSYPQRSSYPSSPGHPYPTSSYPSSPGHAYPQSSYPIPPPNIQSSYPHYPGAGARVGYPEHNKSKGDSGLNLGGLAAAGASALAGVAGSSFLGKKHKKNKHGHGMSSSSIPLGGALGAGAAALAGAYVLKKSPIGKAMKPKKMFKHKYKGWGSSSSSSSSSD